MANFGERIKSYTGIASISDIEFLANSWLTSAAKDVINVLPPQILYIAGKSVSITAPTSNTSVPQSRILGVERINGPGQISHECKEIPHTKRGVYHSKSGFVEEASAESPVFYRLNNNIHILPTLGTSGPQDEIAVATITYVNYPVVEIDNTSISSFPDEIENLVALKASVYGKFYQIGLANTEEDLEVATSHTNHMSALNQEYTMCLQNFLSGYQLNMKEQGVTNDS